MEINSDNIFFLKFQSIGVHKPPPINYISRNNNLINIKLCSSSNPSRVIYFRPRSIRRLFSISLKYQRSEKQTVLKPSKDSKFKKQSSNMCTPYNLLSHSKVELPNEKPKKYVSKSIYKSVQLFENCLEIHQIGCESSYGLLAKTSEFIALAFVFCFFLVFLRSIFFNLANTSVGCIEAFSLFYPLK